MTQITPSIPISFIPSSINEFFSVSHGGKTYELPGWQKTAIILTSIAGIALFGIGILFGVGLSYYFRSRLVEQIATPSSILPKPLNPTPINVPIKPGPVIAPPKTEPVLTDPVIVSETPKPALIPEPVLSNPVIVPETPKLESVLTDPVIVSETPKPAPIPEPVLSNPVIVPETPKLESVLTDPVIVSETPKPAPIPEPVLSNPVIVPETPKLEPVLTDEAAADLLIKQRVERMRTKIDKIHHGVGLRRERINDVYLNNWSMEGRHFLSITNGIRGHKIPDFSPLLLPKGIYCIYFTNQDDITKEWMRVDDFNQMIIEEFGADNIYHLVICEHEPKWDMNNVKKIHKYQLELYSNKSIDFWLNRRTIIEFEEYLEKSKKSKKPS